MTLVYSDSYAKDGEHIQPEKPDWTGQRFSLSHTHLLSVWDTWSAQTLICRLKSHNVSPHKPPLLEAFVCPLHNLCQTVLESRDGDNKPLRLSVI